MKPNIWIVPLCFAVLCCIASCEKSGAAVNTTPNDGGKITVTTSNFAPYDFVREIAGDKVSLSMLLPPGAESHSFEPSPKDIITIEQSDVFIYTGGESDTWIKRILGSMNTDNMNMLSMMDVVNVVPEELVEGMEDDEHEHGDAHDAEADHDHEEEHHHDEEIVHDEHDAEADHDHEEEHHHDEEIVYDEHVWTAPGNAALIVRAITEALCKADPANASFYRENAAAYSESLARLDAEFKAVVAGAKRNIVLFGDRFPFRYFTDAYGLEYYAAFPGCAAETEPSAATVAFLINKTKTENIPVVFHIELSNERMADIISGETGAKKLLLHACHNISKSDLDAGKSYLSLMRANVENLRAALW